MTPIVSFVPARSPKFRMPANDNLKSSKRARETLSTASFVLLMYLALICALGLIFVPYLMGRLTVKMRRSG